MITIDGGTGTILHNGVAFNKESDKVSDMWRTDDNFTISNGSLVTLSGIYERHDQSGYGQLGSGMTESSGVFTFPSTGIYQISANIFCQSVAGEPTATYVHLQTTVDNGSNWDNGAISGSGADGTNHLYNMSVMTLFDVTNVSTHKVRFAMYTSRDDQRCLGQSTQSLTNFNFIRLGDPESAETSGV